MKRVSKSERAPLRRVWLRRPRCGCTWQLGTFASMYGSKVEVLENLKRSIKTFWFLTVKPTVDLWSVPILKGKEKSFDIHYTTNVLEQIFIEPSRTQKVVRLLLFQCESLYWILPLLLVVGNCQLLEVACCHYVKVVTKLYSTIWKSCLGLLW